MYDISRAVLFMLHNCTIGLVFILLNDFLSEDISLFLNSDCHFITRNKFSLIFIDS